MSSHISYTERHHLECFIPKITLFIRVIHYFIWAETYLLILFLLIGIQGSKLLCSCPILWIKGHPIYTKSSLYITAILVFAHIMKCSTIHLFSKYRMNFSITFSIEQISISGTIYMGFGPINNITHIIYHHNRFSFRICLISRSSIKFCYTIYFVCGITHGGYCYIFGK